MSLFWAAHVHYPHTSSVCGIVKVYLGIKHRFQHCTGHITMGSFMDRGNQYIQLVDQGSVLETADHQ